MKINFLLLFVIFHMGLSAQSPYHLDWKKEPVYLGLGVAGFTAGSIISSKSKSLLTVEEIFALDRSSINAFDRGATFNLSGSARNGSDIGLFGSYILPSVFLINKGCRKEFGKIALLYTETFILTLGLTNLTKRLAKRSRPFVYNELASMTDKQTKNARHSFFSGHTSVAAANSFFAAKVFSDYFPNSKWKPVVWSFAVIVPAATGYLRMKAGKHFPTDVITGFAIGGLIGVLIPELHKTKRDNRLSFYPNPNGFLLRLAL